MSETLVAQLQSLRDRIANDPRSAEMFEADCDVLLDAISRIKADKLRQFVKDRASSTYTDRIAALESELAQARAEREQAIAEVECLWVAIQSHCSAATIKAIESELESK